MNYVRVSVRRLRLRQDTGQSLIEFVLVAPLLILLLFSIIEFGLYLNQYDSATNLAEMGARQVIVLGTNTAPTCTYNGTTSNGTLLGYLQCEAQISGTTVPSAVCLTDQTTGSTTPSTITAGDTVTVKVNSKFGWGNLIGISLLNSTVSGSSTMRVEQSVTTASTFLSGNSTNCA